MNFPQCNVMYAVNINSSLHKGNLCVCSLNDQKNSYNLDALKIIGSMVIALQ